METVGYCQQFFSFELPNATATDTGVRFETSFLATIGVHSGYGINAYLMAPVCYEIAPCTTWEHTTMIFACGCILLGHRCPYTKAHSA